MGPLQPAVNGMIGKAVNKSSAKYVYVMSAYSKGPIRSVFHPLHWVFSREKRKKNSKKERLWPHMPDLTPAYI